MTEKKATRTDSPHDNASQSWQLAYAWAVDQMPTPAFLCDLTGAILKCNALAERLWRGRPDPCAPGLWHGWEDILDAAGHPLRESETPAAQAIKRAAVTSMDVVVRSPGDAPMRAVVFSRPIMGGNSEPVGAICAVAIAGPADPGQAEERAAFLSILSHELRNPLSPIMSAAAILRKTTADPAVAKMAEMVDRQSKQLARFIADLLDVSRLRHAHEIPCQLSVAHLGDVLDSALDPLGPTLQARCQSVTVNEFDRSAELRCDAARVAQAIANILSNASTYSPDGADIGLRIYADAALLSVAVDDKGAGIEANFLSRAVEPFTQGPTAPGRAPSGAGLGLAITQSVCAAHGGSMTLTSGPDGRGTHVELMLPIVACPT